MAESTANSSDASLHRSWILLALLVAAHATFALLFVPFRGPETFPRILAMGVIFAQPILLAAWMVFGPPPLIARVPLTIAAFFVVTFCGGFASDNSIPPDFLLIMGGFFAVWTVLMLVVSKLVGWKILNARQAAETGAPLNQFSLKFLLALMTICAILLGVGRMLALRQGWTTSESISRDVLGNIIIPIGFITLAMIPSIVVPLLVLSGRPSIRLMVILPLGWAALTWLAVETIVAFDGATGKLEIAKEVVSLQLGAAAAGLVSAGVVRYCGYRLIRRVAGKNTAAAQI